MNPFADPSAIRSHMVNDQHRMPVRVVHADTGQRDRPAGLLPSPGPAAARTLDDLVVADGPQMTLSAFCDAADTTGLLVRHRGRVVHADYRHGFAPTDLHVTASVSKSVFALLLSHLIHTETIDPDARIESFVPELAGTGFGRASIDHAFHMLTTVRYGGRPFHKETEARAFFAAVGMIPLPADHDGPRTLLDRLATAEEDAPSGRVFRSRTATPRRSARSSGGSREPPSRVCSRPRCTPISRRARTPTSAATRPVASWSPDASPRPSRT